MYRSRFFCSFLLYCVSVVMPLNIEQLRLFEYWLCGFAFCQCRGFRYIPRSSGKSFVRFLSVPSVLLTFNSVYEFVKQGRCHLLLLPKLANSSSSCSSRNVAIYRSSIMINEITISDHRGCGISKLLNRYEDTWNCRVGLCGKKRAYCHAKSQIEKKQSFLCWKNGAVALRKWRKEKK